MKLFYKRKVIIYSFLRHSNLTVYNLCTIESYSLIAVIHFGGFLKCCVFDSGDGNPAPIYQWSQNINNQVCRPLYTHNSVYIIQSVHAA